MFSKKLILIIFVLLFSFFINKNAFTASFDCLKAKTKIEKLICNDTELSKIDKMMGEKYSYILNLKPLKNLNKWNNFIKRVKSKQRKWLVKEQKQCSQSGNPKFCISLKTNKQIEVLNSLIAKYESYKFKPSDVVYFNGCGSNPQFYLPQPLNLYNRIVEVPNVITKIKTSPYNRNFLTKAKSKIILPNKKIIFVELSNFRDLRILDHNNNLIKKHKVSGATSLYEIKFREKVIAWGVGWSKYCDIYLNKNNDLVGRDYNDTNLDFTAFRIFLPKIGDNIEIQENLFSINISSFNKILKKSNYPIFTYADHISGPAKFRYCYYCGVGFIELNNLEGFKFHYNFQELIDKYNIKIHESNQLVPIMNSISRHQNQIHFFKNFFNKNYKKIIFELSTKYKSYAQDDLGLYQKYIGKESVTLDKYNLLNYYEDKCILNELQTYESIAKNCLPLHLQFLELEIKLKF